jgi:MraZ protein
MATPAPTTRMWGHFEHSLDDKGRVIVPLKFRESLGENFVLTMGPGQHIRAFPMTIWAGIEEQLINADMLDELNEDVLFLQRLYGNCEFVNLDKDNRVTIPRYLRAWAELQEGDMSIILGVGTRLEIWSRTNWDAVNKVFTQTNAATAASRRKFMVNPPSTAATMPPLTVGETGGDSVPPE